MGEREEALDRAHRLERASALERAVRALARRDHSRESLRAKLEWAGFSAEAGDEALDALARQGYLDDAGFARTRAAHLAERGYGDEWIRADLGRQGVAPDDAASALGDLVPEQERALAQAAALGDRERAAQTLRRRGFSADALESVLGEVADDP